MKRKDLTLLHTVFKKNKMMLLSIFFLTSIVGCTTMGIRSRPPRIWSNAFYRDVLCSMGAKPLSHAVGIDMTKYKHLNLYVSYQTDAGNLKLANGTITSWVTGGLGVGTSSNLIED